jgi:undecaprenyl-phosphate 4-deoxy-4-formamido-L-arabinose transferase
MMAAMRLSVVVPVYNSERSLPLLVPAVADALRDYVFELVLVDDGSRDGSWRAIESLSAQYPFVRGIRLARNFGQHNALLCGIRAARYEVTVTIDDDLQNPPREIPRLLPKLEECDVVYGTPRKESHGFLRDMASRITKIALQSAMGAETARNVSAFRAFRTALRAAFADYHGPFVSVDVLLTWATVRFTSVQVDNPPRAIGTSNYSVSKLLTHAINMMTGFSTVPLQIASMSGFVLTIFGVGVLAYVLLRYFVQGSSVAGFPFLASIIAIFSGAQLFSLGIIGEYLARIHFRTMQKPSYVVLPEDAAFDMDEEGEQPGVERLERHRRSGSSLK